MSSDFFWKKTVDRDPVFSYNWFKLTKQQQDNSCAGPVSPAARATWLWQQYGEFAHGGSSRGKRDRLHDAFLPTLPVPGAEPAVSVLGLVRGSADSVESIPTATESSHTTAASSSTAPPGARDSTRKSSGICPAPLHPPYP